MIDLPFNLRSLCALLDGNFGKHVLPVDLSILAVSENQEIVKLPTRKKKKKKVFQDVRLETSHMTVVGEKVGGGGCELGCLCEKKERKKEHIIICRCCLPISSGYLFLMFRF